MDLESVARQFIADFVERGEVPEGTKLTEIKFVKKDGIHFTFEISMSNYEAFEIDFDMPPSSMM